MIGNAPELEALFSKRPQVIKPGLDRIRLALRELPETGLNVPYIIVGGTNGKGSTSGFLWHLLSLSNVASGLFTSPHLCAFNERIQLNTRRISDQDLVSELNTLRHELSAPTYDSLSFFEVTTLLAWRIFKRFGARLNVMEVGMGGRWDSTNVGDPLAAAITSIGLDHQRYLGPTREKIAGEKAGIMRAGRPVFLGQNPDDPNLIDDQKGALRVIIEHGRQLGSPVWHYGRNFGLLDDHTFFVDLPELPRIDAELPRFLSSSPVFLRRNFTTSAAVFHWLSQNELKNACNLCSGVPLRRFAAPEAPWPPSLIGRFQKMLLTDTASGKTRDALVDVGHNVDGIKTFVDATRESFSTQNGVFRKLPGLVSILKDKDVNPMLDLLRGILDPIVIFKINSERSIDPTCIAGRHRDLALFDSIDAAWSHAVNNWRNTSGPVVICGSVLAIGEVISYFGACPNVSEFTPVLHGTSPHPFG